MINKQKILSNIKNKDDKLLFSKILDKAIFCEKNYEATFSDFMPMLKYLEINSILFTERLDIKYMFFGGFDGAERGVICFFPEYEEIFEKDFPISILEINYNEKYSKKLSHRDFLGAILGLGIDRTKIGDILVEDDKAICFLLDDILDYVLINLEKVASTKVKTKAIKIEDYSFKEQKIEEKNIIVSSNRLDAVISSSFNIARGKALDFVKGEKVFINFVLQNNASKTVKEGDIITLRGSGRFKVLEFVGQTKKDRLVIKIGKYV